MSKPLETASPLNLKDLDREGLRTAFVARGLPAYRGDQVFRWVWRRGAVEVAAMTDLPAALREDLERSARLPRLEPHATRASPDGTTKLLVRLDDGRDVEAVLIPDGERRTLCVSTQVGCAMGCAFCRTATMGLLRDLRPWEICEQVLVAERILRARGERRVLQLRGRGAAGKVERRLTNLVFMGMGEPLHNLEGTVTACRVLTDPQGLAFPPRRITVSTVGLADRIEPFLARTGVNLAISLNAPDDAVRERLMPVNKKYDVDALLAVIARLPLRRRQRVTFEYVLLAGVNDHEADAERLARRLRGVSERVKINLIPFNPHEGADFERPAPQRVERFRARLLSGGVEKVHVRRPRGEQILAACGQLAAREGGVG
ncbi:MAG: 23S rRNA (adenine(2503)-C(2))-methyltransferase RlmN [Planctomycetota bacterium]|nr:MAG: 23S rRNA (adenine(2503)-C(2))-methyltransferase RlmN [Planctomycetota bacterium]